VFSKPFFESSRQGLTSGVDKDPRTVTVTHRTFHTVGPIELCNLGAPPTAVTSAIRLGLSPSPWQTAPIPYRNQRNVPASGAHRPPHLTHCTLNSRAVCRQMQSNFTITGALC
jgi:hypothetical protein